MQKIYCEVLVDIGLRYSSKANSKLRCCKRRSRRPVNYSFVYEISFILLSFVTFTILIKYQKIKHTQNVPFEALEYSQIRKSVNFLSRNFSFLKKNQSAKIRKGATLT